MRIGSHPSAQCSRAKAEYRACRGLASAVLRARQILALPTKVWKGTRVYAVQCQADFGKGPHVLYIPAGTLWSLIDLQRFRCPYHS